MKLFIPQIDCLLELGKEKCQSLVIENEPEGVVNKNYE